MSDDFNKKVWLALNSVGEALQWDNTYRDQNLGHANTVFFPTEAGAKRAAPPDGRTQPALGDASLIFQSANVT